MAIAKNSPEFELWKEIYTLRNKYSGTVKTAQQLKAVCDETAALYDKYKNTDAHIPAMWTCLALREMFNEELRLKK